MPHIAGVYDPSADETVIQSLLTRMARAIDMPGSASVKQQTLARHAGCVNLLPGEVPPLSVSRAAGVQLMFDGELYNAAELEQWLRGQGQPCSGRSDAELCLALYRVEGGSCFAHLNGQWIIDRVGFRLVQNDLENLTVPAGFDEITHADSPSLRV